MYPPPCFARKPQRAFISAVGPLLRPSDVGSGAQGTLPGVRLAHQAVSGKQPLCQLWRHTSSCRRAIRTIFLIVLNYATRRGVIEHAIQRVRSKRSTRERLPRPCYHERGFPITGFTMESYTLSPSLLRTRRTFTGTDLHSFIMSQRIPPPPFFASGAEHKRHKHDDEARV